MYAMRIFGCYSNYKPENMALPTTYAMEFKRFNEFFGKIRDAQAPPKFTNQLLVDWGFKSTSHRAFIPILKALGFLTLENVPTQRYQDYRNHSVSKKVMGKAIKEAYSDIFLIKEKPTQSDKNLIEGKFKSFHNSNDRIAGFMAKTFFSILDLADITQESPAMESPTNETVEEMIDFEDEKKMKSSSRNNFGLHYNIQIHLPATKDVEVYNAIFKSLKEHLLE